MTEPEPNPRNGPRLDREQIILAQRIVGCNHALSEVPCTEALPLFGITKCCRLEKLRCLDAYREVEESNSSDDEKIKSNDRRSTLIVDSPRSMLKSQSMAGMFHGKSGAGTKVNDAFWE